MIKIMIWKFFLTSLSEKAAKIILHSGLKETERKGIHKVVALAKV